MSFPINELETMVQVAIPTVYQQGLSYYEVLARVTQKVNELVKATNEYYTDDVETHVRNILDEWNTSGQLNLIINAALQTQIDDLDTQVNGDLTTLNNQVAAITAESINVLAYGATGDGATDDTQAFIDAIAATPIGGTLTVPTPTNKYILSNTLIIDKPMRIVGSMGLQDFVNPVNQQSNILEFSASVMTGFDIRSVSVEIEGLTIDMLTTSASVTAGIYYNVTYPFRFMLLRRVVVHMRGVYGACVKAKNMLVSKFDGVQAHGGLYGFDFEECTTLTFNDCWAMNQVPGGIGFKFYTVTYSTLIGCAADSTPHGLTGYKIDNSQAVSLIACGSEQWECGFEVWGSFGISLMGCLSAVNNALSTSTASFLKVNGFCGPVTVIGCIDSNQVAPTDEIYVYPNAVFPRVISCSFTKIKHDIVTVKGDLPEVARCNGMLVGANEKEGRMMILKNASGVADELFISIKDDDDTIKWRKVTLT